MIQYLILCFSDPGYLCDEKDNNVQLDNKILKSIEEVENEFKQKRKKNIEEINYGYEVEIKDEIKKEEIQVDYYSEKNNKKGLELGIDQINSGEVNVTSLRRMVFSTKNAMSKSIQFNEIAENNSEKKIIDNNQYKDHEVKTEDINFNKIKEEEPNAQFSSQRSNSSLFERKGINRPKLQTSIEVNNKVIILRYLQYINRNDISDNKDANLTDNRLINKSNLDFTKYKSTTNDVSKSGIIM